MSALAERLRHLRAQSGLSVPAAPTAAPKPALPANVLRLIHGRSRLLCAEPRVSSTDRFVPGEEIASGLFLTEAVVDWLPPPPVIDTAFARWSEPVASGRLMHFDTETTGLAGGTGTRAFMIGAAHWQADGRFRMRQLTITTMAAERAMLHAFAGWLRDDTVLVSYNGKCYDAPLLATRYRLARLPNPLTGLGHLDLLHPVRRRWKGIWENCRLATAERQLLGVVRDDDLPGSEAPAAWLAYLRGGPATNLRRVAHHNAQDLRSLAGVLLRVSGLGACPPAAEQVA
ncbi:ribonuclease H-like domain-containing protein [Frateuria sp. GZRe12]|uniref:ribonuclease H-like domain-containing protein n=1 Tax=Frateuria sp. GZRe12 TaxID=3351533 RepID=UPI003EDBF517